MILKDSMARDLSRLSLRDGNFNLCKSDNQIYNHC